MSAHPDTTGHDLDEIVAAVPGVVALFSADAALVRAARELTASVVPSMISVRESDDGLVIEASVGVTTEHQVPQTARAVSDAIRAELADRPIAGITVRVARITSAQ